MYRDITFAAGVTRASLAAGPVFLLATALFMASATPQAIGVSAAGWALPLLAIPAIMVGGLLALLPNLIGAALLANLGSANVGLRLPAAWALVGGLVAGGAAAGSRAEPVITAAFAATGAICALLCRSGTRWQD